MISTITSSTISSISSPVIAASLVTLGILFLLSLLMGKELMTVGNADDTTRNSQVLDIAIAPMMGVFILVVITKVVEVLQ